MNIFISLAIGVILYVLGFSLIVYNVIPALGFALCFLGVMWIIWEALIISIKTDS